MIRSAVVLAALVVGALAPPPTGVLGGPSTAPTAIDAAVDAAVDAAAVRGIVPAAAVDPPGPPPLRVAAPSGARPGPAAGLRSPERCTPPTADTDQTAAPPGATRMQLTAAHRIATGAGQLVAVIDTGVSPNPRFGARLRGGGDYLTGGDGRADCDGHGTAVAGIIAASDAGRDSGGVTGIAPDAQVLAVRQSSPSFEVSDGDGGVRPAGDVHTLAEAIVLAVRANASVINISEAACLPAAEAADAGAELQAALRLAARADVVVVAAAGNTGVGSCVKTGPEVADQVALPGWYADDVLTVGAVGPDDAPAEFTVPGPWVDVAAPGTDLRSLAVGRGTTGTGVAGTSFAAPWAAGLAALLRERFPDLTAAQVVDRILATARRPAGERSAQLGRGVIDPVAALTAVPDVLSAAPLPVPTATLPGTTPGPVAAATTPEIPIGPAAGALVLACGAAAWLVRRRPGAPHPPP